ncbi:MAG: cytochrome c-type biogenesis protein [Candidatus Promineifilaceae bacterium]|nr:cytochrome c-type biogenesis protein [Candidatus Promineifilaceae bacterium]
MKRITLLTVLTVLIMAVLASIAAAQESSSSISDDEVNAIAKELYCPVCESTPLDVCPTQACADWREVIRTKLAEGQSEDEIKAYFAEQYGARALAQPPAQGFTLAVWIVPIAAVVVGGFLFSRYLARIREGQEESVSRPVSQQAETSPPPDDYESRIERELREGQA